MPHMSLGVEKAKQRSIWRPRFSIRTLVIFVTVVCCYFGAWEATKRYGVPTKARSGSVTAHVSGRRVPGTVKSCISPLPCLLIQDVLQPRVRIKTSGSLTIEYYQGRHFHLWLFGPTIKLPFESWWY